MATKKSTRYSMQAFCVHPKENNGQQVQQNLVWNLQKKTKRNNNEGKNLTGLEING
jgi:hypothetical protein